MNNFTVADDSSVPFPVADPIPVAGRSVVAIRGTAAPRLVLNSIGTPSAEQPVDGQAERRRRAGAEENRLGEALWFRDRKGGVTCPSILLVHWTDHGMRQVKDSPKRRDKAERMPPQMGGQFKAFYMTMGDHDL